MPNTRYIAKVRELRFLLMALINMRHGCSHFSKWSKHIKATLPEDTWPFRLYSFSLCLWEDNCSQPTLFHVCASRFWHFEARVWRSKKSFLSATLYSTIKHVFECTFVFKTEVFKLGRIKIMENWLPQIYQATKKSVFRETNVKPYKQNHDWETKGKQKKKL